MVDVNFVDYGSNALRLVDTGLTGSEFLADNGYAIGAVIAVLICIILIVVIFIIGAKSLSKLLP